MGLYVFVIELLFHLMGLMDWQIGETGASCHTLLQQIFLKVNFCFRHTL